MPHDLGVPVELGKKIKVLLGSRGSATGSVFSARYRWDGGDLVSTVQIQTLENWDSASPASTGAEVWERKEVVSSSTRGSALLSSHVSGQAQSAPTPDRERPSPGSD